MGTRDTFRFLGALDGVAATSVAGTPIGVEAVGRFAKFERVEAIRIGRELIDAGLVDGVPLPGDDEIKTINGLRLTGTGMRTLRRHQSTRLLEELHEVSGGDRDSVTSSAGGGRRL